MSSISPLGKNCLPQLVRGSLFHLLSEFGGNPVEVHTTISELVVEKSGIALVTDFDPESPGVFLEPTEWEQQPRLLVIDRGHHRLQVNDHRMAGVALLREGDQLRLENGKSLEAAFYHRPLIDSPTEEQVGMTCPVCLTKVTADTRVFCCPCGQQVMHHEIEGENPLECVDALTECVGCGKPITLTDGYLRQPAFLQ